MNKGQITSPMAREIINSKIVPNDATRCIFSLPMQHVTNITPHNGLNHLTRKGSISH